MALDPFRAVVDEARCSGCRICNGLCPFSAILFDEAAATTSVNPALCQGCGVCVAACPAGAIRGTGFSDEQILGQIEGLLMSAETAAGAPSPASIPRAGVESREAVPA
jgi:heterodisulfide reductase subunit A